LVVQKLTDGYGNLRLEWFNKVSHRNYTLQKDALKADNDILTSLLNPDRLDDEEDFSKLLAQEKSKLSYAGKSQLEQYVTTTKEGLKDARDQWGQFYATQQETLDATQTGTKALGTSFKTLGKNIFAMGVNMLAIVAVVKGIELITKAIDNAAHASERAIEAAENMKTSWDELDSAQKTAEETVAEKGDRFLELHKGVDAEGHNLSLTSEQYEEYISLSNEIAGIFPTMVQGFNEQGNAILNTTDGLAGLNEQLKELQRNTRSQKLDLLSKVDEDTGKTGFEGIIARLFAGGSGHVGSYTQLGQLKNTKAQIGALQGADSRLAAGYLYREFSPDDALEKIAGLDDLVVAINDIELTEAYGIPEIQEAVENARAEANEIFGGAYELNDENITNLTARVSSLWEALMGAFSKAISEQERLVVSDLADFRSVSALALEGAFDAGGDARWGGGLLSGQSLGQEYSDTLKSALSKGIGMIPAEVYGQIGSPEELQKFYQNLFTAIASKENAEYRNALEKLSRTKTAYDHGEATIGDLQSAQKALENAGSESPNDVLASFLPELVQSYGDNRAEAVYNALAQELKMADAQGKATQEARSMFGDLTSSQISAIIGRMNAGTLHESLNGQTGEAGFNALVSDLNRVKEYRDSIAALNEAYSNFIENRKTAVELAKQDTLAPKDYTSLTEVGYGSVAQYNPLTGGYDVNYRQYRELSEQKATKEIAKLQEARAESQAEYNKLLEEANNLLADQEKSEGSLAKAKEKAARMQELDAEIQRSKLMEASYRRLGSALQAWRDAKDFGESGDEFREIKGAIDDLREGLDEGRIGTNKFRAALELIFGKGALDWDESTLKKNLGTSLEELEKFYKDDGNLDLDYLNNAWEAKGVLTSFSDPNTGEKRYRFADNMTSIDKVAQTLGQPKELVGYLIGAIGESVMDGAEALYSQFTDGSEFLPEDENTALDANTSALEALTNAINDAAKRELEKEQERADTETSETEAEKTEREDNPWAEEQARYWEEEGPEEYRRQINAVIGSELDVGTQKRVVEGLKSGLQQQLQAVQEAQDVFDPGTFSAITAAIQGLMSEADAALEGMSFEIPSRKFATEHPEGFAPLEGLDVLSVPVDADTQQANKNVEELQSAAEEGAIKPVDANTSAAMQGVYALDAAIRKPVIKPVLLAVNGTGEFGADAPGGTSTGGTGGTGGSAAADGTPNAKGGTTLVAELGPEIIVDRKTGTWRIAKEPQLTSLNKGDIVFNASDTEKILARRGGASQGESFATGTQKKKSLADFAQKHTVVAKFKTSPASSYVAQKLQKSSSNDTKVLGQLMSHYGNSVIEPRGQASWSSNSTSKSKSGRGGGGGSGGSDVEEEVREVFDWIQRALEVAKKATQKLIKEAARKIGYIAKNKEIDNALKANQKEIDQNQAGYNRYQEHLRSLEREYGFGPDVVNRVKNGEIDLHKYNEDLRKQLEDYIKWHDLAEQCLDTIDELKEQEKELNLTKLDNIIEHYDQLIERQEASLDLSSAERDYKVAVGKEITANDYTVDLKANNEKIRKLQEARAAYKNQFDALVSNGMLEVNSDDWHEYIANLEDFDQQLVEAKTDLAELNKEIAEIPLRNLQYAFERLSHIQQTLEGMQGFHDAQGTDNTSESYVNLIRNGMEQIANLEQQNAYLHEQQAGLDILSDRWQEIQQQLESNEQSILDIKTSQEAWNDAVADLSIQKLQDERDELEKTNDELQRKKDLQQAIEDLEKARSQRNKLVYREGIGFVYEADQDAIRDAEDRLSELQHQELLNKIDDAIDAIEESKKDDNVYDYTGTSIIKDIDSINGEELYKKVRETLNLDALLADKAVVAEQSAIAASPTSGTVFQFGDIMLYGVQDADSLAQSIVNELPNRIVQKMYGR